MIKYTNGTNRRMKKMTEQMKAYYRTRTKFRPVRGCTYENAGGGTFRCLGNSYADNVSVFVNVRSGWTFIAHGVGQYIDKRIDWDYSTGGYFA